jgi:hypothetical protein
MVLNQLFTVSGFHKYIVFFILAAFTGLTGISAQTIRLERGSIAFFDSLDHRISDLQKQIPRLKQSRDVAYYNMQRELELTIFVKNVEEYIHEEDLDNAKKVVDARLEKAEFRKEQYSVTFCRKYKDDVNDLIKQQRIHYQALFAKEKNFKREFDRLAESGSGDNYQKTLRMVNLALKYANENNLTETIKYLDNYKSYTEALIFDAGSDYDLAALTGSAKEFEKVFIPLVESDSIENIHEAESLISNCKNYSRLTGSRLDPAFFSRQGLVVTSSLSDLLESKGREKELERYTDQAVKARIDSLNPCGVFKWHDQIIVIDEFKPSSTMEAVKKGEAIIHADKMLAAYLKKNKLCTSEKDLSFGYAFVIPYHSDTKNSAFFFNTSSQKWQYITCYTSIIDAGYTQHISKYMPPLLFRDEKDLASN